MADPRQTVDRALRSLRRVALRRTAHLASAAPSTLTNALGIPGKGPAGPVPTESQLRRWAVAVGVEYQAWCFHHGFVSLAQWHEQREASLTPEWDEATLYSIITPVHNAPPTALRELVYSTLVQTYPYWELCLVDDATTDDATRTELDRVADLDPRIRLERLTDNVGVCEATNRAIAMANGAYVAFVDHDDRISPDALYEINQRIAAQPDIDLVYSDRDLLDDGNYRTEPTFKPGWAPETLLGGNYMFHLGVYRRTLVERLGGYRAAFEGSQDLDLALRAAETNPIVAHVPKVLYHWRQHEGSMAQRPEDKPHIFAAGLAAVRDALERRDIAGTVEEIPDIWRGHYRVHLGPSARSVEVVEIVDVADYRAQVAAALATTEADHLVVIGSDMAASTDQTIAELCAWLELPDVVASCARVVSSGGWLRHAGLVRDPGGPPLCDWYGFDMADPGYLAGTVSIRNVSLVHPLACAWRTDVLRSLGGLSENYESPYSMLDAAVAADIERLRFVYNPLATFVCDRDDFDPSAWSQHEAARFAADRAEFLTLDGHYNLNFDRSHVDHRIALAAPAYSTDFDSNAITGAPEQPPAS